jgi:peptidoglycan/LPS O-acetylase OafA/YrhL
MLTVQNAVSEVAVAPSATHARAAGRDEVPALTGLRFVAAFSVLFAHGVSTILASYEEPLNAIYWLRQASGFGMTLFFVLSGFVIHYNYASLVTGERQGGVAAYLWARFARLYPLFLLMLLVNVLASSRTLALWAGHPEGFDSILQALPYFLVSVQSWFYVPIGDSGLISAIGGGSPLSWSISTEWFFYFLYPVIAWLVVRLRRPSFTVAVTLIWCAVWIVLATTLRDRTGDMDAWAIARYGAVAGHQNHQADSFVRWLLYFSPYLRMGEFMLGTFVAQLYVQVREKPVSETEYRIGLGVLLAALISALLITWMMYSPFFAINIFRKMDTNFALAPTVALLIFCAARYRSIASRMLTTRPAIVLGEASYSIYLVHYVVLMVVVKLMGPSRHGIIADVATLVVVLGVILVLSIAMFTYYEAPARKWLRAQWGNDRKVVALAAAPAILAIAIVAVRHLV